MTQPIRSLSTIDVLVKDLDLDTEQEKILRATGAQTPEQLYAVFQSFPSLAETGRLDVASITNELAVIGGESFRSLLSFTSKLSEGGYPSFSFGAKAPNEAEWTPGMDVALEDLERSRGAVAGPPAEAPRDVRLCLPWPVRDQGQRGTCVSFAVAALREALDCQTEGRISDLSEQFLYWAIKQTPGEPFPGQDGTLIDFAVRALNAEGICEEPDWPYDPVPIPGNPGQGGGGDPSAGASLNAKARRHAAAVYERRHGYAGSAARVAGLLRGGRPVAVSLPVFSDPLRSELSNWTTPLSIEYGWVADPQPTSLVSGGHAVCLTGYVGDPTAPGGGWFVIRNSWGTSWGRALPDRGYVGPEPGYGQLSAYYVERFLWEVCQL